MLPNLVTLSLVLSAANGAAKGLAQWVESCFAEFPASATNGSSMTGKALLQQLVCPDVACHSLWSSHPSLVSGDILDTAVAGGDSVDGSTPRKQGMGLG